MKSVFIFVSGNKFRHELSILYLGFLNYIENWRSSVVFWGFYIATVLANQAISFQFFVVLHEETSAVRLSLHDTNTNRAIS